MVYVLMLSDIIAYAQRVFSGDGRYMLFRYSVITFSSISSMILLIFAFFRIPRTAEVFSFLAFGVLFKIEYYSWTSLSYQKRKPIFRFGVAKRPML